MRGNVFIASSEKRVKTASVRVAAARRRGQSAIEFTLVIPILLLIMTGLLSFGLALHNFMVLTSAVNTGAQLLAISRGQTTDPCATAHSAIAAAAPSLNSGLSLTFVIDGSTYSSTTSCTAGAADMVQGAFAQITASYPCSFGIFEIKNHACNLQTQISEFIQ
jgi:Flp pilus assembly protein TadG